MKILSNDWIQEVKGQKGCVGWIPPRRKSVFVSLVFSSKYQTGLSLTSPARATPSLFCSQPTTPFPHLIQVYWRQALQTHSWETKRKRQREKRLIDSSSSSSSSLFFKWKMSRELYTIPEALSSQLTTTITFSISNRAKMQRWKKFPWLKSSKDGSFMW